MFYHIKHFTNTDGDPLETLLTGKTYLPNSLSGDQNKFLKSDESWESVVEVGAMDKVAITGDTVSTVANGRYINTYSGNINLSFPLSAEVGDEVTVYNVTNSYLNIFAPGTDHYVRSGNLSSFSNVNERKASLFSSTFSQIVNFSYMGDGAWLNSYENLPTTAVDVVTAFIQSFITEWTVDAATEITLPLNSGNTYNFTVDWGDDTAPEEVTAYDSANKYHTYTDAGTYTITIAGTCESWNFQAATNASANRLKLTRVVNLGNVGWKTMLRSFYMCEYLTSVDGGGEYLTEVDDFSWAFYKAYELTTVDTVLDIPTADNAMYGFYDCGKLEYVAGLNSSSCENFSYIFNMCDILREVGTLNTSSGKDFGATFQGCFALTGMPALDLSNATDIDTTFHQCQSMVEYPPLRINPAVYDYKLTWYGNSSLVSIDSFYKNLSAAGLSFGLFAACSSLTGIPTDINLSNSEKTELTFGNCTSLRDIPNGLDIAAATNAVNMFDGCSILSGGYVANCGTSIGFVDCNFDAAHLDAQYTALDSGVTAKTISVGGNPGLTSDTPSIATTKGWTVDESV